MLVKFKTLITKSEYYINIKHQFTALKLVTTDHKSNIIKNTNELGIKSWNFLEEDP